MLLFGRPPDNRPTLDYGRRMNKFIFLGGRSCTCEHCGWGDFPSWRLLTLNENARRFFFKMRTIYEFVPRAGLEPARLAPHAPQTCVYTSSTTWALILGALKANRPSIAPKPPRESLAILRQAKTPSNIEGSLTCFFHLLRYLASEADFSAGG